MTFETDDIVVTPHAGTVVKQMVGEIQLRIHRALPAMAGLQIEVEEPDLSMELMGQLRVHLSALEADYMKEVRKEGSEAPAQASRCAEKYSDLAAAEIACMLQSFNPEISEEDLARDVHSIIHTQSVVGHLHQPMLTALRECVPLDRRAWFANDIHRHLLRQRRRRPFRKVLQIFRQQTEDIPVFGPEGPSDRTECLWRRCRGQHRWRRLGLDRRRLLRCCLRLAPGHADLWNLHSLGRCRRRHLWPHHGRCSRRHCWPGEWWPCGAWLCSSALGEKCLGSEQVQWPLQHCQLGLDAALSWRWNGRHSLRSRS
eukprot:s197_g28.t1